MITKDMIKSIMLEFGEPMANNCVCISMDEAGFIAKALDDIQQEEINDEIDRMNGEP